MSIDSTENTIAALREDNRKRKKITKSIREARQKLVDGPGIQPEFKYDQLFMCARNELGASLAIPLLAVFVAATSYNWFYSPVILNWLCAVFGSQAVLIILCRKFVQEPRNDADVKKWRLYLTAGAFLSGLSWASIALLDVANGNTTADIVIFATLVLVLCIRTMFASTMQVFIYASTIPLSAAITIRLIMVDTELAWVMATMAIGIHAFFMFLARSKNKTILSMLELRSQKDALIAEIEEAKAFSDEARLRAESANLAKSRFLATVSHELRTPLNAILGFSEILKSELFGPHANPTYKEYAEDIHDSGEHLLKVINDILDISRIEAERYELKEEALNLQHTAEDCVRLLHLRAENKGLQIKEQIDTDLPKVWAEEKSVRQVFINLLSNAIKFTPRGGTVVVEIGCTDNNQIFIAVHDDGPGIPKEELKMVLRPFGQGSLAHENAEGGTGLGLPIVQRLMEIHGGTFAIDSELRKGTSATATFPAKRSMKALPPLPLPGENTMISSRPAEAAQSAKARSSTILTTSIDSREKLNERNKELNRLEHLAYGKTSSESQETTNPSEKESDLSGTQTQKLRDLAEEMREKNNLANGQVNEDTARPEEPSDGYQNLEEQTA